MRSTLFAAAVLLTAALAMPAPASAATVAAVDHCGSGHYAQVGPAATNCIAFGGPVRPVACSGTGTRVQVLTATTTCIPVTPSSVETCGTGVRATVGNAATTCVGAGSGPTVNPCPGGYYVDWYPYFTTTCLPPAVTVTPCPGGYRVTVGSLSTTCLP